MALGGVLRGHPVDGVRFVLLSPRARQRAAVLGPAADDDRLRGIDLEPGRRPDQRARGACRAASAAGRGRGFRRLLARDGARRRGQRAAVRDPPGLRDGAHALARDLRTLALHPEQRPLLDLRLVCAEQGSRDVRRRGVLAARQRRERPHAEARRGVRIGLRRVRHADAPATAAARGSRRIESNNMQNRAASPVPASSATRSPTRDRR